MRWRLNLTSSKSSGLGQAVGTSNNSFEFERILAQLRHIETQENSNDLPPGLRPCSAVRAIDLRENEHGNVGGPQLLGSFGPRGLLTFDHEHITFPSAIVRRPLAGESLPQYSLTDTTCPPPYFSEEPKEPKELHVSVEEV